MDTIPSTYEEALSVLNGRSTKKVANNTYLDRFKREQDRYTTGDPIALRLHHTDVATFFRRDSGDEYVVLNTGGWKTVTTKDRLNRVLRRNGANIYQEGQAWYLNLPEQGVTPYYEDVRLRLSGGTCYLDY